MGRFAEDTGVRIERLELETQSETVELTLHPLLTVVTGLGRLEREALSGEILGALGAGRPGLSLDMVGPDGKFISVSRPLDGAPSVTDSFDGTDLTAQYQRGSGIDLLGSLGLDKGQARTLLRMGRHDVRPPEGKWQIIERLAELDQGELWSTATEIARLSVELEQLGAEVTEQRGPVAEIETAHETVELAADALADIRRDVTAATVGSALAAVVVALLFGFLLATPLVLGAAGGLGFLVWRRSQLQAALTTEEAALSTFGVGTYLDYQMEQVEEMTDNTSRSRRLELMDAKTNAESDWRALTGDGISLAWAVDHRPEILRLAEQAKVEEASTDAVPDVLPRMDDANLGAFDALKQRLGQLTVLFPDGMIFLLDDPLADLEDFELTAALTLIDDALDQHQLILMSDDPRIVGWARQLSEDTRALIVHLGGNDAPAGAAPTNSPVPAPALIDA